MAIPCIWLKPLLMPHGFKAPAIRQPIGCVLGKPGGMQNGAIRISIMDSRKNSTCILFREISGGFLFMTRDEAIAILEMDREDAIQAILSLAEKAENYDRLCNQPDPTTPSGMTPPYLKPTSKKRKRPCGRKPGHKGISRKRPVCRQAGPEQVTAYQTHTLENCPACLSADRSVTSHCTSR